MVHRVVARHARALACLNRKYALHGPDLINDLAMFVKVCNANAPDACERREFDCIAREQSDQTVGEVLHEHNNQLPLVLKANEKAMAHLTIAPFVDPRPWVDWLREECRPSYEVAVIGARFNGTTANLRLAATSVVLELIQHLTTTADRTRSTQRIFNGLIALLEELAEREVPLQTSCSLEDLVEDMKQAGKTSTDETHVKFVRQLVVIAHDSVTKRGLAAVTFDTACTDGELCVPMRCLI